MVEDIATCVVVIVFLAGFATLLRMGRGISLIAGIKNVPEEEREKTAKGFSKVLYLISLDIIFFMISLILENEILQNIATVIIFVIIIGAVALANLKQDKKR